MNSTTAPTSRSSLSSARASAGPPRRCSSASSAAGCSAPSPPTPTPRGPTTSNPAPQVEGVGKVDGAVWIELLNAPLARLKAARAKVNQEGKELAAAIHGRDQAMAAASEAMVEALQLARALTEPDEERALPSS